MINKDYITKTELLEELYLVKSLNKRLVSTLDLLDEEASQKREPLNSLLGKESILFVDDDVLLLKKAQTEFENLGYQITLYDDVQEALNSYFISSEQYDLVIIENKMPKISGIQFINEACQTSKKASFVLLLDQDESVQIEDGIKNSIKEIFNKPINFFQLVRSVRIILDRINEKVEYEENLVSG